MALQLAGGCAEPCPPRESFGFSEDISENDIEYILANGPQGHYNGYVRAEEIPCKDYCIHFGPTYTEGYDSWEVETCVFNIDGYEPLGPLSGDDVIGSVECSGTWQPRCPFSP